MSTFKYIRDINLFTKIVDDEIIVTQEETGAHYVFNKTAKIIWELLEEPMTKQAVVDKVASIYKMPKEHCKEGVENFFNTLVEKQLIGRFIPLEYVSPQLYKNLSPNDRLTRLLMEKFKADNTHH